MNATYLVAITCALATSLHAGPRSSASYSVRAENTNSAGTSCGSTNYSNHGSMGDITTTTTNNSAVAKSGFLGQIYDVTSLALTANPAEVSEDGTLQLTTMLTLDDNSMLAVTPDVGIWSVLGGPIAVSDSGLASGQTVFADVLATVSITYLSFTSYLDLTVVNVHDDDFGIYAFDGLPDDWQVLYFGKDNPLAAPDLDPDGDGFTNLFEFTAKIIPTDAASRFRLRIESVTDLPTHKRIIFSPCFPDRTYIIENSDTLGRLNEWLPLTSFTTSNDADERTVTDTDATQHLRFYRVNVTKP